MVRLRIFLSNLKYLYDTFDFDEKINFFKSLISISETVYVSKSDYYWWCFDGCQLIDKKIHQDKDYYDYAGRDIKNGI